MSTRPGRVVPVVLRATVVSVTVLATLVGYAVPSALLAHAPAAPVRDPDRKVWHAAYSEAFPGCVATVLWPDGEQPAALLVVDSGGRLSRVPRDAVRPVPAAVRTIGACR